MGIQTDFPSPREVAQLLSGCFFLSAVILAVCGLCVKDVQQETMHWSKQPWIHQHCEVLDSGISYHGDCPNMTASANMKKHERPKYHYRKCQVGTNETFKRCSAVAKSAYDAAPARRLRPRLRMKRGQGDAGNVGACLDVLIVWAKVAVNGRDACAYEYGITTASKLTVYQHSEFEEAVQEAERFKDIKRVPCWHLSWLDGYGICDAVALADPKKWAVLHTWIALFERWVEPIMKCTALSFAVLAAASSAFVIFWGAHHGHEQAWEHFSRPEQLIVSDDGHSFVSRVTDKTSRSAILRARWNHFQDTVLSDYQLVSSVRGIEVAETIEHVVRHHEDADTERSTKLEIPGVD